LGAHRRTTAELVGAGVFGGRQYTRGDSAQLFLYFHIDKCGRELVVEQFGWLQLFDVSSLLRGWNKDVCVRSAEHDCAVVGFGSDLELCQCRGRCVREGGVFGRRNNRVRSWQRKWGGNLDIDECGRELDEIERAIAVLQFDSIVCRRQTDYRDCLLDAAFIYHRGNISFIGRRS
jgi:hypothetical protein